MGDDASVFRTTVRIPTACDRPVPAAAQVKGSRRPVRRPPARSMGRGSNGVQLQNKAPQNRNIA